jgi:hypothetical protein
MKTVYNIQNNYDNTSNPSQQNQSNFDPIGKLIEIVEKRDDLVAELQKLYEALLQAEREKNALLTELLREKRTERISSA